jgi:chemotaxis protein methyltransferase CheR
MRWEGFRKPRRQVCKRVRRRAAELGLAGLDDYAAYLASHPDEWAVLDRLCVVTISRFFRDRAVFEFLAREVLPVLGRDRDRVEVWSVGCAAGEEPYSLALLSGRVRILATDSDPGMLRRAREACYKRSSLKEVPPDLLERAFVERGDVLCLDDRYRRMVEFREHDVRGEPPAQCFDLILCRNLLFTYFDRAQQERHGAGLVRCLRTTGALVIGSHETLPSGLAGLTPWAKSLGVFRRVTSR